MKKSAILAILILTLTLGIIRVFAQEEPTQLSDTYRICDWGLVVIQPATVESTSNIAITSPENHTGIAESVFTVSGTGKGLFENNVIVKVADRNGNVLFEVAQTMTTDEIGGEGEWAVDVDLSKLATATPVVVEAFSTDPSDGLNVAYDNVLINANSSFGLSYVEITKPTFYESVSDSPLVIEGTAGAIFENNIVVQILDYYNEENILAETFATVQTNEIGGSGSWVAEFELMLEPGTTFNIRAFQPPVADDEALVVEDSSIGIVNPLALGYDQILVLQSNDIYIGTNDFCNLTASEFDNDSIIPILVNKVEAISTLSLMPTVNVTVQAQKPSVCDLPVRIRVTGDENNFFAELYYSTAEGDAICTRDLQPFTIHFPLGTLSSDIFNLTVNEIALE